MMFFKPVKKPVKVNIPRISSSYLPDYNPMPRLSLPQVCACCMSSASEHIKIFGYSETEPNVATMVQNIHIPVCQKCKAHSKWVEALFTGLVFMVPFLIAFGVIFLGFPSLHKLDVIALFICIGLYVLLVIPSAILAAYYLNRVWPAKHPEHAHVTPVTVTPTSHSLEFTFYNHEYAKLFYDANSEIIKKKP